MNEPDPNEPDPNEAREFLAEAKRSRPGFLRELALFLRENKKWWLTPIVLSILILGALVFFGGTGAAPFIYTIF